MKPSKSEHENLVAAKPMSTYLVKPISWIVDGCCAKGKVAVIASEPGLGCSLFATDLAARVSSGANYPFQIGAVTEGNVLFLAADQEIAQCIHPRLTAAKANLEKVHCATNDLAAIIKEKADLGRLLEDLPWIDLLIVDAKLPWARVGNRENLETVPEFIDRLGAFAAEKDLAVALTANLLPGAEEGGHQLAALSQSSASVVLVLRRGAENSRTIVPVKNTVAADIDAFALTIESVEVAEGIFAPKIKWKGRIAASLLRTEVSVSYSARRALATNFVADHIFDGKLTRVLLAEGKALGLSKEMIQDAAHKLGYEPGRCGGIADKGYWVWTTKKGSPDQGSGNPQEMAKPDSTTQSEAGVSEDQNGDRRQAELFEDSDDALDEDALDEGGHKRTKRSNW